MNILLQQMGEKDIPALTVIMKNAFDYDTRIHLGKKEGGPPGYDDGSFLRKWGLHPAATSYCIYLDKKLAGGIILWISQNKENRLGNIFIDPAYENKGIGTRIWQRIEQLYPDTKIWYTETPIFSHRNHNFYINKCGFHVIKIENPKNPEEGSFVLQKIMN